jgi:hypothetical protein
MHWFKHLLIGRNRLRPMSGSRKDVGFHWVMLSSF